MNPRELAKQAAVQAFQAQLGVVFGVLHSEIGGLFYDDQAAFSVFALDKAKKAAKGVILAQNAFERSLQLAMQLPETTEEDVCEKQ